MGLKLEPFGVQAATDRSILCQEKRKWNGIQKKRETRGERKICIIFEPESLHILVLYLGHIAVQFLCSKEFIHTLNSII